MNRFVASISRRSRPSSRLTRFFLLRPLNISTSKWLARAAKQERPPTTRNRTSRSGIGYLAPGAEGRKEGAMLSAASPHEAPPGECSPIVIGVGEIEQAIKRYS